MSTKLETAQSLSKKMTEFRNKLSKAEQDALDKLLIFFNNSVASAPVDAAEKLLGASDSKKIMGELSKAVPSGKSVALITPTITTITITTTLASHPIITCNKINTIKASVVKN